MDANDLETPEGAEASPESVSEAVAGVKPAKEAGLPA